MNITKIKDRFIPVFIAYVLVLAIGTIAHLIKAETASNRQKIETYKAISPEERLQRVQSLEMALGKGPNTSAEYFELLTEWTALEMAEKRFIHDSLKNGSKPNHPAVFRVEAYGT